LKDDPIPVTHAVGKLIRLTAYSSEVDGREQVVLDAQEVEKVVPSAISKTGELDYNAITAVLVNAVKELSTEIAILKRRVL